MTNQIKLLKNHYTLDWSLAWLTNRNLLLKIVQNSNIFLMQYRKIVCKNIVCDMGLRSDLKKFPNVRTKKLIKGQISV
jgi:hypothetical protein